MMLQWYVRLQFLSYNASNKNSTQKEKISGVHVNFQRYKSAGEDTIVVAGAEYGSGSSRDWAAKGPMLQVSVICIVGLGW